MKQTNINPYQIDILWERMHPLPTFSLEEIHALFAPAFGPGLAIQSVEAIHQNSISNFNYCVSLESMSHPVLLRFYSHQQSCALESALLHLLKNDFTVPQVYYFGQHGASTYALLSWVEGTALPQVLPSLSETELTLIGKEIGLFLSKLHQKQDAHIETLLETHTPPQHHFEDFMSYLEIEPAGSNLAPTLLKQLRQCMMRYQTVLTALDNDQVLIHGDFKIQNILCQPTQPHQVAAVLDWESSRLGSHYTDLGHLFRGPLPKAFSESFLFHYQTNFQPLPTDWLVRAKLCDLLSLMSYLNTHIPMPNTFKGVQQLIKETLAYLK